MTSEPPVLYFDFVDPLSYRMAEELGSLEAVGPDGFRWEPLELRPPPTPLTTRDDPDLAERWATAGEHDGSGRRFAPPLLVPWTRKAHELVRHAAESGLEAETRTAIFDAYLIAGRDIGRIDVLVDVAREVGLAPSETRPVLDVDRHEADVSAGQADALAAGVVTTPTLVWKGRRLEGFHNAAAIRTFLGTRDLT